MKGCFFTAIGTGLCFQALQRLGRDDISLVTLKTYILFFSLLVAIVPTSAQINSCSQQVLPFAALDQKGKLIPGLAASDLEARASGKAVNILAVRTDPRPRRVVLMVDASGSMSKNFYGEPVNWMLAILIANHVIAASPRDTQFAFVFFNQTILESIGFDRGRTAILSRLKEMETQPATIMPLIKGPTALFDSIAQAFQLFPVPASTDVILLIGDGGDNVSKSKSEAIIRLLYDAHVRFFWLGIKNDTRSHAEDKAIRATQNVAEMTGGIAYFPPAAKDPRINLLAPGDPQAAELSTDLTLFYPSIFANEQITIQLAEPPKKAGRLEISLGNEAAAKWRRAKLYFPAQPPVCSQ